MGISICGTGHRPDKLYGYNIYRDEYDILRDKIFEVLSYIKSKYGTIEYCYDGLALGWDRLLFETCHFALDDVKMIGCIPFAQQDCKWRKEDKEVYKLMKTASFQLVYVDEIKKYQVKNTTIGEYHVVKMQRRNEFMVDNSDIVVSCWNHEKKGGTWNCIRYALQNDRIKEIININPSTLEVEILKN